MLEAVSKVQDAFVWRTCPPFCVVYPPLTPHRSVEAK